MWFRRDLRLRDHPALAEATAAGSVLPLFVLDDRLLRASGAPRRRFLTGSLEVLDRDLRAVGSRLHLRGGRPEQVVPQVVAELGAASVHVSADFAPYGAARDEWVRRALGSVPLVATGSPYAVSPGRIRNGTGDPYRVFTAFYRAWVRHGWRAPADSDPGRTRWLSVEGEQLARDPDQATLRLPDPGEQAALRAWEAFLGSRAAYAEDRDRPDRDSTSRMSAHLRFGAIHPRTMLADLGPDDEAFRRELAWREFYADVLHHRPDTVRAPYRPEFAALPVEAGKEGWRRFNRWAEGSTGYPIVDAGMRQLLGEGWMHNRVRMIAASFLVKDLHVPWQWGARYFLRHLVDGDLASNHHGWQWVAGCGTDAAPYFRIFNPVTQGEKFDPQGEYVRRWVPELATVPGKAAHRPWLLPEAVADYPEPMVDHAAEREAALKGYEQVKAAARGE
jgi:deoxyribodipyrimidine photo-lyase